MLIDTHAHLDADRFARDLPDVVKRAEAAGLVRIIAVGITAASSRACLDLAQRYPLVVPTVGIHPNSVAEAASGDWDEIVRLAADPRVVGVGETGLDRHWDNTPFDQQEINFARHLELSRRTGLPIVIHSRDCDADTLRHLRAAYDRFGPIHGVMHSFSGDAPIADACVAMGLYLSFSGPLTYKNAETMRAVAARAPADRILVETDCPYLTPEPFRGKRNEPAHVAHTARKLAEVRGVSFESIAELTTANAMRLFSRRLP